MPIFDIAPARASPSPPEGETAFYYILHGLVILSLSLAAAATDAATPPRWAAVLAPVLSSESATHSASSRSATLSAGSFNVAPCEEQRCLTTYAKL